MHPNSWEVGSDASSSDGKFEYELQQKTLVQLAVNPSKDLVMAARGGQDTIVQPVLDV